MLEFKRAKAERSENQHWNAACVHLYELCRSPANVSNAYEVVVTEAILEELRILEPMSRCCHAKAETIQAFAHFVKSPSNPVATQPIQTTDATVTGTQTSTYTTVDMYPTPGNMARAFSSTAQSDSESEDKAEENTAFTSLHDVMMKPQKNTGNRIFKRRTAGPTALHTEA